jgi:hypothetical protein
MHRVNRIIYLQNDKAQNNMQLIILVFETDTFTLNYSVKIIGISDEWI